LGWRRLVGKLGAWQAGERVRYAGGGSLDRDALRGWLCGREVSSVRGFLALLCVSGAAAWLAGTALVPVSSSVRAGTFFSFL
jgi:hypothetical protein